jgi:hypothetical protein
MSSERKRYVVSRTRIGAKGGKTRERSEHEDLAEARKVAEGCVVLPLLFEDVILTDRLEKRRWKIAIENGVLDLTPIREVDKKWSVYFTREKKRAKEDDKWSTVGKTMTFEHRSQAIDAAATALRLGAVNVHLRNMKSGEVWTVAARDKDANRVNLTPLKEGIRPSRYEVREVRSDVFEGDSGWGQKVSRGAFRRKRAAEKKRSELAAQGRKVEVRPLYERRGEYMVLVEPRYFASKGAAIAPPDKAKLELHLRGFDVRVGHRPKGIPIDVPNFRRYTSEEDAIAALDAMEAVGIDGYIVPFYSTSPTANAETAESSYRADFTGYGEFKKLASYSRLRDAKAKVEELKELGYRGRVLPTWNAK